MEHIQSNRESHYVNVSTNLKSASKKSIQEMMCLPEVMHNPFKAYRMIDITISDLVNYVFYG